jgi:hypothetical protein
MAGLYGSDAPTANGGTASVPLFAILFMRPERGVTQLERQAAKL